MEARIASWSAVETHAKQIGNVEEKDEFLETIFSVIKLE